MSPFAVPASSQSLLGISSTNARGHACAWHAQRIGSSPPHAEHAHAGSGREVWKRRDQFEVTITIDGIALSRTTRAMLAGFRNTHMVPRYPAVARTWLLVLGGMTLAGCAAPAPSTQTAQAPAASRQTAPASLP